MLTEITDITFLGKLFKNTFKPFIDNHTLFGEYGDQYCKESVLRGQKWLKNGRSISITTNLEILGCIPYKLILSDNSFNHYYRIYARQTGEVFVLVMQLYDVNNNLYEPKSIFNYRKHFYDFIREFYLSFKDLDII